LLKRASLVCCRSAIMVWSLLSRRRIVRSSVRSMLRSVVVWGVWLHCWTEGLLMMWCENTCGTLTRLKSVTQEG
jgi:hypothetical protein